MITAGIDAGSRTIKVVLANAEDGKILGSEMTDQGLRQDELAGALLERVARNAGLGLEDIGRIVATGYGRNRVEAADRTVTEITCHARGVIHLIPDARTVVDIGGQDSKLLRLDPDGRVHDFAMNDRCAAGTGRFLEIVANRLETPIGDMGLLVAESQTPAIISSMCVVFAETEIVGLLAAGTSPADIAAGIQVSIATRVATLAAGKVTDPVVFTGGVALVPGMQAALESALGRPVKIPLNPVFTGALGAALLAMHLNHKVAGRA